MAYFSKDFTGFFKELAANNNKEWFDKNKKRYEKEVKEPFQRFIDDVIKAVHKADKSVNITSKEAIFRINRDVRFSKDKTPYKVQVSAIVSPGGRKEMVKPGMYLELTPEHVRIYGGVYMPEKDDLYSIRAYIKAHLKDFENLIKDKKFTGKYGKIRGEVNKIIPPEFKEAAVKQPLLYNKQFYFFTELKPNVLLKDDLVDLVMENYFAAKPLSDFLNKALQD